MAKRKLIPVSAEETQRQPPPVLPEKLLKAEAVMEKFDVSRSEITSLMKRGMPHYKLGGGQRNLRFVEEELAVWFAAQKVSQATTS